MSKRSTSPRLRRIPAEPALGLLAAVLLLSAAASQFLPRHSPTTPTAAPVQTPAILSPAPTAVFHDSLGPGETLSQIWERNGRPRSEMAAVVLAANVAFDVRQLRPGTPIEIHSQSLPDFRAGENGRGATRGDGNERGVAGSGDSAAPLDSVVIRIDADRTLAIRPLAAGGTGGGDAPFAGELRQTPVREVYRTHVGCIESSLYAALESGGEDFSLLALELDRIYGGVIDFYSDLQPGDCVALHFQTFVRPDGSLRLGRIESAELENRGQRYPAVYFEAPDGTGDYYDGDGNSLRRRFLRSPLKFTRISSGFTLRRYHPILKRYRAHPGIDYAAPAGTPVQAVGNGVVTFAGWKRGYGKVVEIKHGKVYATSYAHLSRIPAGVRPQARVSQGQVIGYVGSTGLSTGPHLDYRFAKNGRLVNALNEVLPSAEPVAAPYVTLFAERRDRALALLGEAYHSILVDEGGAFGSVLAESKPAGSLLIGEGQAHLGEAGFGDD